MSNGRTTGRTFRTVLQALAWASSGKIVKVICATPQAQTEAVRLAKEISRGYNRGHTPDSVVFQTGGLVKFVHNHSITGHTFDEVITDDATV